MRLGDSPAATLRKTVNATKRSLQTALLMPRALGGLGRHPPEDCT